MPIWKLNGTFLQEVGKGNPLERCGDGSEGLAAQQNVRDVGQQAQRTGHSPEEY